MSKLAELDLYMAVAVKNRPGLVQKPVTVHREGKVFTRQQWVRPEASAELLELFDKLIDPSKFVYPEGGGIGGRAYFNSMLEDIAEEAYARLFPAKARLLHVTNFHAFDEWKTWGTSDGAIMIRLVFGRLTGKEEQALREIREILRKAFVKAMSELDTAERIKQEVENKLDTVMEKISDFHDNFVQSLHVSIPLCQYVLRKQFGDKLTVYRGVSDAMVARVAAEHGGKIPAGKVLVDNGIVSSWSLNPYIAVQRASFQHGRVMKQIIDVDDVIFSDRVNFTGSGYAYEDEIIFRRDSQEVEFLPADMEKWSDEEKEKKQARSFDD